MATEYLSFHWADYVVLSISLLLSLGIGIFFFIWDRRKKKDVSNEEYLMGGRSMNPFSTGLSSLASTVNAVFLIGAPAEIYRNGILYSLVAVSWFFVGLIAMFFLMPAFRRIKLTSCYEYLGVRFNSLAVRTAGSLVFILTMILFLAVTLYAPALAFAQVTGLSIHILQIILGTVCTLYVFLGGLKAVVWTDTLQMLIMIIGCVVVGTIGSYKIGGLSEVWRLNQEGNRINFLETSFHPHVRHTIWTQLFLQIFIWLPNYGANQMIVQRYMLVKSTKHARIAILSGSVALIILVVMVSINGLVMYAYFFDCDPLKAKRVKRSDQMFLFLVMQLLGQYPGIPGLFTAAVFSAALSSISSAINSLTAVILEDFIKPIHTAYTQRKLKENYAVWIAKGLTLFLGLATIAMSYLAPLMGPVLIQITPTIAGTMTAPLFGVFLLAIYSKSANAIGVLTGLFVSLVFGLWWTISGLLYGKRTPPLQPLGECENFNMSLTTSPLISTAYSMYSTAYMTTGFMEQSESPDHVFQDLYDVSYTYYGLGNTAVSVIVGFLVSVLVNCIRKGKSQILEINPKTAELDMDTVKSDTIKENDNKAFEKEKY